MENVFLLHGADQLEIHHMSNFQTSYHKSVHQKENIPHPFHKKSGRWQEASGQHRLCSAVW